jgi:hypothetical protein
MSEFLLFEPDDSKPQPPTNARRGWGWSLLTIGALTTLISGSKLLTAGTLLVGDMMSGGAVPGHGQSEINGSVSTLAVAPIALVFGIIAAVVGLVLVTWKPTKKNE